MSSRRNTLVPVNRIPPEILQHIFLLIVSSHPLESRTFDRNLESFSVVCHYWRQVSLEHAALWTCPQFERSHLALAALHRSKTMPLDLRAKLPLSNEDKSLRVAPAQRGRIHGLCFILKNGRRDFAALVAAMQAPLPALREFISHIASRDDEDVKLPRGILDSVAAQLQVLMIHGARFVDGTQVRFENLTSLILGAGEPDNGISLADMLETLRRNPRLTTVKLREIFNGNLDNPPSMTEPTEILTLPFLEELVLHDDMWWQLVHDLIMALDLPRCARLDVRTFHGEGMTMHELGLVTKAITNAAHSESKKGLYHIEIEDRNGDLCFFGWSEIPYLGRPVLALCVRLRLRNHELVHTGIQTFVDYAVRPAPYWKVTEDVHKSTWKMLLESLNVAVTHLHLDSKSIRGFLQAIEEASEPDVHLEVLVMAGVNFAQICSPAQSEPLKLAEFLLISLSRSNLRVEELRMRGCKNGPSSFDRTLSLHE